eukprot:m.69408 g.69408  ORF g.69408 m.69408 type:complete len:67 (+) comp14124_c0_seq1:175-375(+)
MALLYGDTCPSTTWMLLHSTFSSSCNNPSNKAYHTLLFHKEAVGLACQVNKYAKYFWDLKPFTVSL